MMAGRLSRYVLEATAQDDAVDVLDLLIEDVLHRAEADGERARLRTLRDLDAAALRLRDACLVVLEETEPAPDLRTAIFAQVPRAACRGHDPCRRTGPSIRRSRLLRGPAQSLQPGAPLSARAAAHDRLSGHGGG
jgi:hypothetical protein